MSKHDEILNELSSKLSGQLILNSPSPSPSPSPSSPAYQPSWNNLVNHLPPSSSSSSDTIASSKTLPTTAPLAYVRCLNTSDVVLAMQAAKRMGVRCYARGNGHHYSGTCLPHGGIVIDLSRMKAIEIDADGKTAIVEPGVTTEELRRATITHGLHFPSGHISSVGISGFILGGGNGWGVRHCGSGADNLIEAEVVLPSSPPPPSPPTGFSSSHQPLIELKDAHESGEEGDWSPVVMRASHESDPELFWGLKGAGAFLGIVTRFTLSLHTVPSHLPCLTAIYPLSALNQVGTLFMEIHTQSPRELEVSLALVKISNPKGEGEIDAAVIGCVSFAEQGSNKGIEAALDRLRSFQPTPTSDGGNGERIALVDTLPPYLEALSSLDEAWGFPNLRMYSHGAFVKEERFDGGLVKVLKGLADDFTSARSLILVAPAGTHPRAPRSTAMGFSGCLFVAAYAMWEGQEEGEKMEEKERESMHVSWVKRYTREAKPWIHGLYLNEVMIGTDGITPSVCFEDWALTRIVKLKEIHDPFKLLRRLD